MLKRIPGIFLVISLMFLFHAFAQSEHKAEPSAGAPVVSSNADSGKDMNIPDTKTPFDENKEKQEIRTKLNNFLDYDYWKAVRVNDKELCSKCSDKNSCLDFYSIMSAVRVLAKRDCANAGALKNVCNALSVEKCETLPKVEAQFCNGLLRKDAVLLKNVLSDKVFMKNVFGIKITDPAYKGEAELMLAVYQGFAGYGKEACEDLGGDLSAWMYKAKCETVFYPQAPDIYFEELVIDLFYFSQSRKMKSLEECGKIGNKDLKRACYNKAIKTVDELFDMRLR